MGKVSSPPKNIHVQNHAPIAPADYHVKIEYFAHVSWWHINHRSYIHNWVIYITKSHSPLWHICCCIAWILRLLYITMWQMIYVSCMWKLHSWQFILLHTYLRFLYHKKYLPFLHIYCLVSCCLTSETVIYITMLWMKIVSCWCMLWMKLLMFCGVMYITIYMRVTPMTICVVGNSSIWCTHLRAKN